MSSGNVFESLYKIQESVNKMVVDGARNPEAVLRYLQRIVSVEGTDGFVSVLDTPRSGSLITTFPQELWAPSWEKYYRDEHGVSVDLGSVMEAHPGEKHLEFSWPVFPIPEVGLNCAFAKCRDHYTASSVYGDDMERVMRWHQRTTANGPYLVRFRPRPEADEENKNLSANELEKNGAQCITLHERVLLEDFVWCLTGGFHLDLLNWTLCAGSRGYGGRVPSVCWGHCKLQVDDYHPDDASGRIRARSAV